MSNCAYCNKQHCHCTYKHSKLGKKVITAKGIKLKSTAGEMLQTIVDQFAHLPLDMKGAWLVSFTEYDDRKIERNVRRHEHAIRPSNKVGK